MPSQGPLSPTTVVDDAAVGTGPAWSNPGNAVASDNTYALYSIASGDNSHYLKATGFGFTIPSGAIILGIVVEIERKASNENAFEDEFVRLVRSGVVVGANKAILTPRWPTAETIRSYGGDTDLWDETWTADNINDPTSGVVLSVDPVLGGGTSASVDHIKMTVYYQTLVDGEAVLQAATSMSAEANYIAGGESTLDAVATMSADGSAIMAGEATLQATTGLSAEADAQEFHDFTVYDAYLNRRGLLFYQDDEGEYRPSTVPEPLQPVRQDVGNNPAEMRPESGFYFAQADFSHGAGQPYYHRPGRDERMYYYSEGFDISKVGKLKHLRAVAEAVDDAAAGAVVVAADLPFVAAGTVVKRGDGLFPGTWANENPQGADGSAPTVNDLTTSGTELFAATSHGIHRRDAAGVWTHWSTPTAAYSRVAWIKDRLFSIGGTNDREFHDHTTVAPTVLTTLPEGWKFTSIFEAGGFTHATAVNENTNQGRIYHYGLNTAGTAIIERATTKLPEGHLPYGGTGYLAVVHVGIGKRNPSGGKDPLVYTGTVSPEDGSFTLSKLVEEEGSGTADHRVEALSPYGESLLCGWSLGSPAIGSRREGLAVYHLGTGAVANHLRKAVTANPANRIRSIAVYKGRVLFTVNGDGLYYEDLTKYAPTAELISSIGDWNNAGDKVWDTIEVGHKALPVDTSVKLDYTKRHPEEGQWLSGLTSVGAGEESERQSLSSLVSRIFTVRLTSTANPAQTAAPEDITFTARSNPKPRRTEYRITRFIRLFSRDRKDDQGEDVFEDPVEVLKELQDLLYTWNYLYEPGFTWFARLDEVAKMELIQPVYSETEGTTSEEGFLVQLSMLGTREN